MLASSREICKILNKLEIWVKDEEYKGWEPYDGLNSNLLKTLTFKNRYLGIVLLQFFKRCPINLRSIFGIKKEFNPKGMGLFLSAYLKKYTLTKNPEDLRKAEFFANWLQQNSSKDYADYCWGYNFDWPNRTFYVRKGVPTVVSTCFIANAFLEAYELLSEEKYLRTARSSCDFIMKNLNRSVEGDTFCFSYTPEDNSRIHNANMIGAALLARVYVFTKEAKLRENSEKAVKFTINHQNGNGSWYYGEADNQKWIDLFHTGYVLEALEDYMMSTNNREYENNLRKGFSFFLDHFFLVDGIPKYYHNRIYPIDIHSSAQAILTLLKLKRLNENSLQMARKVAGWTIDNMWDYRGYFYYQKNRYYTNRIPYIRWSQAWMFYALAKLLTEGYE